MNFVTLFSEILQSRRQFLKYLLIGGGCLVLGNKSFGVTTLPQKKVGESQSTIYRCINGSPGQNVNKLVELMGGANSLVGAEDVIIIKPNVQWWNQGAPNLLAVKTFVELIMERPGGFQGEVVLAENCHRGLMPWKAADSGWLPYFQRNSDGVD